MNTYHYVLYVHLLALFVGIGAGAVLLACLLQLRAARTVEQAAPWGMMAGKMGKLFPVAILGLFASGAYLTNDRWSWSTRWIDVSIAALVLVAVQGPLVAGGTASHLTRAVREHAPGPLGEHVRSLARAPALWFVVCGNPAIVLAIVWNMTVQPGTAGAIGGSPPATPSASSRRCSRGHDRVARSARGRITVCGSFVAS